MVPMLGDVHLKDGWDSFWSAVTTGGGPGLTVGLSVAGVIIVLGAAFKYLWDRRRGNGGMNLPLIIALIIGGACAGPGVILPLLLGILDLILNIIINIVNTFT
jgi:hypothetical protein